MSAGAEQTSVDGCSVHFGSYSAPAWWAASADAAGQDIEVGSVDAMEISGKDFVGPIVGVFAVGAEKVEVMFEGFDVDYEWVVIGTEIYAYREFKEEIRRDVDLSFWFMK